MLIRYECRLAALPFTEVIALLGGESIYTTVTNNAGLSLQADGTWAAPVAQHPMVYNGSEWVCTVPDASFTHDAPYWVQCHKSGGAAATSQSNVVQFESRPAPTHDDVISEGQLELDYYPNCTTQPVMDALIEGWINSVAIYVKRQVGAANWASVDADIRQELRDCVLYFTLARAWQVIMNVMVGYDAEALPPEFVDPEQAAAIRDFYLKQGKSILAQYDVTPPASAYVGAFDSEGVVDDTHSVLGLDF